LLSRYPIIFCMILGNILLKFVFGEKGSIAVLILSVFVVFSNLCSAFFHLCPAYIPMLFILRKGYVYTPFHKLDSTTPFWAFHFSLDKQKTLSYLNLPTGETAISVHVNGLTTPSSKTTSSHSAPDTSVSSSITPTQPPPPIAASTQ